jgi:hypothetical protein
MKMAVAEAGFYEGWSVEFIVKITQLPIATIEELFARLSKSI